MWNEVSAPGAEQECRGQSTEQDVRMLWECSCIPPGFHFREDLGFNSVFADANILSGEKSSPSKGEGAEP